MIEIVDHDPEWARAFEALRTRYEAALAGVPRTAIEHVGSTAVDGLAAKPVIDIDIVVRAEHLEAAAGALRRIGYEPRGELGIPGRWAFRAPADVPRTNTYLVLEGCLALRNHLGVRDVLRADPGLRDEYAALKRRLAATVDDLDTYGKGKSELLSRILAAAGLSDEERADIELANRVDAD